MKLTHVACATAAVAAASPIAAQTTSEDPFFLGTIVLESFRSNGEAASIPGTVQVIDREQLERRVGDGQSLERVLSHFIPGLSPSNGTIGGAAQTMRGRNLQILIDGVARTSELRGFDRELSLINPDSIERIEVIRGSNAQLGNGATGGLINIITRDAGEVPETTVTTRLSTQPEDVGGSIGHELSIAHDTRLGDLGLRFELATSGIGTRYDGAGRALPSDPIVGQGGGDNSRNYQFGLAADYAWGANEIDLRFDASAFEQDIEFFTDYSTNPVSVSDDPYTGEPVTDETQALSVTWENTAFGLGDLEVQGYATRNVRQAAFVEAGTANTLYYPISPTNPAQRPDSQSILTTRTYGLRSTVRSDISDLLDDGLLTWGIDLGRDEVDQTLLDGTEIIAPMTQNSYAAFAQLDFRVGARLELSAGVRYERFDLSLDDFVRPDAVQLRGGGLFDFYPALAVTGGDFTYDATVFNIGAVWEATETLDVFAGYSQGFSLPDVGAFTRRAFGDDPSLAGQTISFADIAPEAQIVDTIEVGLRHSGPVVSWSTSAFYSTSDTGAVFDSGTNTIEQQAEEIWGFEAGIDYAPTDVWSVGMIAAFTEGRFDDDGDGQIDSWLPNSRISSPFTATLYSDYEFENGLQLAGEVVYTGSRSHADLSRVQETTRVNVRGSLPLGNGNLGFGVENLFDTNQLNPTATTVRQNPITLTDVPVADEGRRIFASYSVRF